ncbi:MAG: peptidoglycan DD-metalloendopeptidase family protein, partial [Patescibacteria group bacterium]|nr:peptidoglycan DD-metalloendopeptidase family protein [Patescibacteria group bacterium]
VISSISQNLPGWLRGVMLPVVLVLGVVMADLAFFRLANPSTAPDPQFIEDDLIMNAEAGAFVSSAGPMEEIDQEGTYEDFAGFVLVEKSSLSGTGSPLNGTEIPEEDILTYTVKDGDTLSSIAKEFGILVGDILEANDKGSSLIRPGEELAIVPVSKSGGTLGVAKEATPVAPASASYFIRPVDGGLNWGEVHDSRYMPAVDISKACGSPIYAAASGTVTKVGNVDYYNSGYGGYVIISHPNGSKTLYSHNSKNLVEVGEEVGQGQQIANVGNTGRTYGSTGCHVHFGVSGATNPFIK